MIKLLKSPTAKTGMWFAYVVVIGVVFRAPIERMPYVSCILLGIFILIRLYRTKIAESRVGKSILGPPTEPEMFWAAMGVFWIVDYFYSRDIEKLGMGVIFLLIALRMRNKRTSVRHVELDPISN